MLSSGPEIMLQNVSTRVGSQTKKCNAESLRILFQLLLPMEHDFDVMVGNKVTPSVVCYLVCLRAF